MKTNITQPNPSLPYPPDNASDYEKLLHRTLTDRLRECTTASTQLSRTRQLVAKF